jgi:hypothetical protein
MSSASLNRRIGFNLLTNLIPFACALLVLSGAAFAADFPFDPICKTVQNLTYPAADLPTAAEAKTLGTCDSSDLFFGMNGPIDHERGRKCAYLEMEGKVQSEEDTSKDFLRGARLLALIYGNGIGVNQNYPLSEKFACHEEYTFSPVGQPHQDREGIAYIKTQVENELNQLEAGRASNAKEPIGLCSSFLQVDRNDMCQPFEVKAERSLAVHRALDRIAPSDSKRRSALDSLLKAEAAFRKVETDEIDQDGDSAAIWDFNANRTIDQEFFALLDSLFDNSLPNASESTLTSDDDHLNEAWRNLKVGGTATNGGMQGVERAWITYRDAWTHFVEAAFPAHSGRDVSDVLTRHRTDMLGCLNRGRPYQEFKNGHPGCSG